VVAYWCWRVRTARPEPMAGLAATGAVGCLISPVTWVHHGVAAARGVRAAGTGPADRGPAFVLLGGARQTGDRTLRRHRLGALAAGFVVMSSSVVWLWWADPHGWAAFPGSNTYAWLTLVVLAALTGRPVEPVPGTIAGLLRRGNSADAQVEPVEFACRGVPSPAKVSYPYGTMRPCPTRGKDP
jgi:alpha-1,2-mannosyltransferase